MLIAQVTDIHAAHDNNHLSRLEHVLSWLDSFQPDMLVLTGDLTDGYGPEGYAQMASMLTALPYPLLLLPGNADNRGLMRHQWGNESWAQNASGEALHFSQNASGLHLIGLVNRAIETLLGIWNGWICNSMRLARHLCCCFCITMFSNRHTHPRRDDVPWTL